MTKRINSGAVQADADVCNAIMPPARGCRAGAGLHLDIPADWLTRVLAGQSVPGCTYHALEAGGALYVIDLAVTRLGVPAIVAALTAQLQAQAALLNVKLATAVVVGMAAVETGR